MKKRTTGAFGARYGRKIRNKIAEITRQKKQKYKCPYCHQLKVKRLSVGIWYCNKCDSKFTGRAYTLPKKPITREKIKAEE